MLSLMLHLVANLAVVESLLAVVPESTAAKVGSRAVLRCHTNLSSQPVTWVHRPLDERKLATRLYVHGKLIVDQRRYSVNASTIGQFDLAINSVSANDSGTYLCRDDNGFAPEPARAKLIVVRSLSCSANVSSVGPVVEGQPVGLRCAVEFVGDSVSVVMSWYDAGSGELLSTRSISGSSSRASDDALAYEMNQPVNATVSETGHECNIRFTAENQSLNHVASVDIPGQSGFRCIVPPVDVQFPVCNVRIDSSNGSPYTAGESVECRADGNPSPTYEWFDVKTSAVVSTNGTLNVLKEGQHTYRCVASNVVRDRTHVVTAEITLAVFGSAQLWKSNSTTAVAQWPASIAVTYSLSIGLPCLIVAAVILTVVKCSRKRKHNDSKQQTDVHTRYADGEYDDRYEHLVPRLLVPPDTGVYQRLGPEPVYDNVRNHNLPH